MRKFLALFLALFVVVFSACASTAPVNIAQLVSPQSCMGNVCKEDGYEIAFEPITIISEGIGFTIRNTGTEPISVLWDECAFINTEGQSSRIMHTGVRYSERDAPQAPSMIAPGSVLKDEATPTSNVNLQPGGGWYVFPLFWTMGPYVPHEIPVEQLDGKKAGLYLTLKVGETKKAQQYLFQITTVTSSPAPAGTANPAPVNSTP